MANELVRYEVMRVRLAECADIDEVEEIRGKAAKLEAYARIINDQQMEVEASIIKGRAIHKAGLLSGAMTTAQGVRTELHPDDRKKSKVGQLASAGISTSRAHEYEQIAGGREQPGRAAAAQRLEQLYEESRETGTPVTIDGMRKAIQQAVDDTRGGSPKPRHREPDPLADEWIDLTGRVKHLANMRPDLAALAEYLPAANPRCLGEAKQAAELLRDWISALEDCHEQATTTA